MTPSLRRAPAEVVTYDPEPEVLEAVLADVEFQEIDSFTGRPVQEIDEKAALLGVELEHEVELLGEIELPA